MRQRLQISISLARKVSILFGTAVLLVIAVTLLFPYLQMEALNVHSLLWQAKRITSLAHQSVNIHEEDWASLQQQLELRWPALVRDLGVDPKLRPRFVQAPAERPDAFQQAAIQRLTLYADQRYYWRDQGDIFRFAMAVRGTDLDQHPDALHGIVDLAIPVPKGPGVWNWVVTILAGASGAVLAILVFYLVTQRLVLTPVRSLRKVAEHVTKGDTDVRAAISSGDEFEALAQAFNEMLDHLRKAEEEQRKINRSLDIRLGELAETNVALYESNRLKSEFLANVSHELRTPLVSIIGFAELLRDAGGVEEIDRKRLARYSQNILSSGRSLLDIINDLLDLTKIEAGKMQLHLSEFSIIELCNDLIDFVRPLADKKNQTLRAVLPEDAPQFRSDSGKVKQILYNLLSNAIKFTPPEGAILLAIEADGAQGARLMVQDTGPGIPPEQQQAIFEKFHQIDASRTREYEGTGLGLAITKELVEMLGGSIHVESAPGEGAKFIVAIPTQTEAAAPRPKMILS
jgi:signal transduction histidine kinase